MTPKPPTRPRTDADDLDAALARRHTTTPTTPTDEPTSSTTPPTSSTTTSPAAEAPPAKPTAKPTAKRVSWYIDTDTAARFAALVDDLHWTTRRPKLAIVAALLDVAMTHADDARTTLTNNPTQGQ